MIVLVAQLLIKCSKAIPNYFSLYFTINNIHFHRLYFINKKKRIPKQFILPADYTKQVQVILAIVSHLDMLLRLALAYQPFISVLVICVALDRSRSLGDLSDMFLSYFFLISGCYDIYLRL